MSTSEASSILKERLFKFTDFWGGKMVQSNRDFGLGDEIPVFFKEKCNFFNAISRASYLDAFILSHFRFPFCSRCATFFTVVSGHFVALTFLQKLSQKGNFLYDSARLSKRHKK